MEKKTNVKTGTRTFISQAWVSNGRSRVTGESLILAMLLHTTGAGRNTDDMETVQTLMNDININN